MKVNKLIGMPNLYIRSEITTGYPVKKRIIKKNNNKNVQMISKTKMEIAVILNIKKQSKS